ncbi:MAG: fumarylacetoacetate hydrolase family protein [Proteobacteria bacterium]|nr:fumarylacetoacetate hydrolase family protein [Pseudomonadota bacterium]
MDIEVPVLEERPSLPVLGTAKRFSVRRAFCVGRNYAAHAREMGANPDEEPPFFFMKPAEAIFSVEADFTPPLPIPPGTSDYHFETELVVAMKSGGRDIPEAEALTHVFGYAVGLDMTRRDLQNAAKKKGHPWEFGKAADFSGPVGVITPHAPGVLSADAVIRLEVNGVERQRSTLNTMIWSIPQMIALLSRYFVIRPGDLIFSGTPEGVGAVAKGDALHAEVAGLTAIDLRVV